MRKILLDIISFLSYPWRLIPFSFRKRFFFLFFVLESRGKSPESSLRRMFALEDSLSLVINERALALGNGEHPKHELTKYHQFFISNLTDCKRIADLGCGYGAVARSIALAHPNSTVVGIDNDLARLNQARSSKNPRNLTFELQDLHEIREQELFDGVVLSNVLEHIENRVEFLKTIIKKTHASRLLIRVPNFERHWSIPLRKNLGINYFQDDDHKIEHTIVELTSEIYEAGFMVKEFTTQWGEIWAVCVGRND